MSYIRKISSTTLLASSLLISGQTFAADTPQPAPLMIQEQGSFAAGGIVTTQEGTFDPKKPFTPDGQTYHADHLYTFYQIPVNAKNLPIVMWHGYGQSTKTWETTADGREGFQNIFLRRNYPVYLIDQPRRGNAGRSSVAQTITPKADEQFWFGQFRLGVWPNYFNGVQFAQDEETFNQYFRQMTPDTGKIDINVVSDATSALFDKIGDGILFTHSHSGGLGWPAVMKNDKIKAVVSFEPGSGFVFPENEMPDPMPSSFDTLKGQPVSLEDFKKLTQIPILIIYGDNIPKEATDIPTQDAWRVRLAMAEKWRDIVNAHGGDVTLIHLPEIGIKGNTHFPFSDLNNIEIADLVSKFFSDKKLDQ